MQYEFITDLSEKDYFKLIDKKKNIHYKTDIVWSLSNGIYTILYVALKQKRAFLSCAKIEIINHDNNIYFNIPNLTILKNNEINKALLINEILNLAKIMKAYKVTILNIDYSDSHILKKTKEVTNYGILTLQNKNKYYDKKHFEALFKKDSTKILKCDNKYKIEDILSTIDNWKIKLPYDLKELIKQYKNKCMIIVEKLDLVYYSNKFNKLSQDTIDELISTFGEEMIVGFAVVLYPNNKENAYCITLEKINAFNELNIEDNLILKIISSTTRKKYNNIIFNMPIRGLKTINEYKYQLILKNLKYWALKLQKKED